MSKKLLNEATVRKFMKLANLSSLSSPFLKEMEYKRDEEVMEEGEHEDAPDLPMDDEPGDELPMGDEPAGGDEHEELLKRVVNAVAQELDVEVDIEAGGDDEPAMDDEPDLEEMAHPTEEAMYAEGDYMEEGSYMEEGEYMEEDMMAEAIMNLLDQSNIQVVDDRVMTEALVKKVAARVARRLLKESL